MNKLVRLNDNSRKNYNGNDEDDMDDINSSNSNIKNRKPAMDILNTVQPKDSTIHFDSHADEIFRCNC